MEWGSRGEWEEGRGTLGFSLPVVIEAFCPDHPISIDGTASGMQGSAVVGENGLPCRCENEFHTDCPALASRKLKQFAAEFPRSH